MATPCHVEGDMRDTVVVVIPEYEYGFIYVCGRV